VILTNSCFCIVEGF